MIWSSLNTMAFVLGSTLPCLLSLRLYFPAQLLSASKHSTISGQIPTHFDPELQRKQRRSQTCLFASKDGKTRKPPKSSSDKPSNSGPPSSSSSSSASSASSTSAPRVSNRVNIPVRQQIAWAKAYKQISSSSSSSSSTPAVKFRKAKSEKAVAEEAPNFDHLDFDKIKPPAVFVDGYNIIGQLSLQEHNDDDEYDHSFSEKMTFEDRRDQLISDLAVLHGATGWCIEVVFDANKIKQLQNDIGIDGIRIVYTSGEETADGYIERRFFELKNEGFTNMVVATDDLLLRNVAGLNGLGFLTASMLLEDIRYAYRSWDMMQQELEQESAASYPSTLGENLPPEILAALQSYKDDYYGGGESSSIDSKATEVGTSASSSLPAGSKNKSMKKERPRKNSTSNQGQKATKRSSKEDLDLNVGLDDLDFLSDDF